MPKASKQSIRLLHENQIAAVATWWKAFALTPFWLLLVLGPVGALTRATPLIETAAFVSIILFGIVYFVRDLLRRRIVIDDNHISCGFTVLPLETITEICMSPNWFHTPEVVVKTADGGELRLNVFRLSASDMDTLLNALQKRAPKCRIDCEVDAVLRYKKSRAAPIYDTTTTVSIPYHARSWDELPRHFSKLFSNWGRFVGPIGTLLLCTPLWLAYNSGIFFLYRDFSYSPQTEAFYKMLVSLIEHIAGYQNWLFSGVGKACFDLAQHPIGLPVAVCSLVFVLISIISSLGTPNRITLDPRELSLDLWTLFHAFNTGRLAWVDLVRVSQVRRYGATFLRFERRVPSRLEFSVSSIDSGQVREEAGSVLRPDDVVMKQPGLEIPLKAIDVADRMRLLQAIRRFAPECQIEPEVIELLEPTLAKSYTQLWLQSLSAAPERKNLEPLKPGDRLDNGRYEVIRKLGVGGQGSTYLCCDFAGDPGDKRVAMVALKETIIPVFVENIVRQQAIERFLAEADLLKKVNSEHVVALIDHFVDDHRGYLVLEHIEGGTLRQMVAEAGPLPPYKVRDLAGQMCQMLEVLHARGVIHRDFTPDNLILTPSGCLKLIDFNVAQEASDGSTDTIVGKHAYVPPEQFRGKPCKASDVYALGATVYYLLTGRDPEPISQSCLPGELAVCLPDLDELVRACTAVGASERPALGKIAAMLVSGADMDVRQMQGAQESPADDSEDSEEGNGVKLSLREKEHV